MRRFSNFDLIKVFLLIFILSVFTWIAWQKGLFSHLNPEDIQLYLISFGIYAPLIFIAFYTLRPLIFFPSSLLCFASGITFGPFLGTLYTVIGASLGTFVAFGIARLLGRTTVTRLLHGRLAHFDQKASEKGFQVILFTRLVPVLPFDAVNYGAGLSQIKFCDFALATLLGLAPHAYVYNYIGDALLDIGSPQFYKGIILFIIIIGIPAIYQFVKNPAVRAQLQNIFNNKNPFRIFREKSKEGRKRI